jgi:L-ascorbate metabolism protein UlaG (beta-lactamase superfamily)
MDWWEHAEIRGVQIHCTPARHYSGRTSMNNATLWTSWLVKGHGKSFYYSGDTGYANHFKPLRARLGAPDMALMKIGAYGDTWLDIHMNPESAIQTQQYPGASTMLPVHLATFNLAYRGWAEPIVRAFAAAKEKGVHIITPRIGEKFEFGVPFFSRPWFQAQQGS